MELLKIEGSMSDITRQGGNPKRAVRFKFVDYTGSVKCLKGILAVICG